MYLCFEKHSMTAAAFYQRSQIADVPDDLAGRLIAAGRATACAAPNWIAMMTDRLADGAGKPCLFLPFLGEFGHEIMTHIRMVHCHHAGEKIICCRPGSQVLYPSADQCVTDWRDPLTDMTRIGTFRDRLVEWPRLQARWPDHHLVSAGNLSQEQEMIHIQPETRIEFKPRRRGLRADIVLGVRRREFCPQRNWPHWQALADAIRAEGLSFAAIGTRPTTLDLAGQVCHSADYDTDAAVELLQNCRLYVGTDTGTSHLAAAVGARMLIFRESASGSRDLTLHMAQVNPGRVEVEPAGWEDWRAVIGRMRRCLPAVEAA